MKQNISFRNYSFILMMMLALSACNNIGVAKFDEAAGGIVSNDISFSGISSIDQKTDTTLRINWTAHPNAVAYHIFNTTSGSPIWMTTINGQAETNTILTGLTSNQLYKFRVKAMDTLGLSDGNTNDVAVTMNLAPDMPSALTLVTPAASPDFNPTPTVQISGVKNGDTIKLFSNSNCTGLIASNVAAGPSINLTSSSLTAASYTFSANATNSVNQTSSCSSVTLAYQKLSCPSNYVKVLANPALGTNSDFCVMKYEAKSVAGIATSQPALAPWVSITQVDAKTKCTDLGTGYDLISNQEWMTTAHNIENVTTNWGTGVVGSGALYRGHSDSFPYSMLAVGDVTDPYDNTVNTSAEAMGSGKEQRRTFNLSNGEEIWDLAGNAWEWVDWTLGGALDSGPTSCNGGWFEFPVVNCGALAAADYMPGNPAVITAANYDQNYGLGAFFAANGGAALRGGDFTEGPGTGVFTISLYNLPNNAPSVAGFRCVYRP